MATVLVLDGLQRKSLAVTRYLGMAGHRVLTAEVTWAAISRFSRYAARSFVYPPPGANPAGFLAWLHGLLAREHIDAILSTDDDTTEVLSHHQAELAPRVALLVPPLASFLAMRDKAESSRWFEQTGVPHPRTFAITDLRQVRTVAAALGTPLVIKARISAGSRGIRYVDHPDDVEAAYVAVHREYPWPLLQQYITPGPKYSVCLLYDRKGRPVLRHVQRELRQYPVSGGPSTLHQCVQRPDLTALLEPLFAVLPWAGPLEADVMEDGRLGQPYVLEVNPRYWNSLDLAHRVGVNFAAAHLALALGEPLPPVPEQPPAWRGRSLLPSDILAYLSDPNRRQMDPPFFQRDPHTFDDMLSWSDPGPTLGFFLAVGRYVFSPAMWRTMLRLEHK